MMEYEVRFISKRWQHHSDHSGYDRIALQLGSIIKPLNLNSLRYTWIPGRIAVWLARHSDVGHYSYRAFYDEWAAARDMFGRHNTTIYHILYGDESYRYLGNMRLFRQHRLVATYHQPPAHLKRNLHSAAHLHKLHAIIVVAKNQIPFFESIIGSGHIYWVPHGVDTTIFCPIPISARSPSTSHKCLFVGMHKRDFETLRRVIELIWVLDRNVRFTLVTTELNFGLFTGLHNIDLRCGVSEPELVELYQNADILLQPLQDCTANNAILEGLSCGLPVIATDIGGVRDYMNEGCGVLVPPQNAKAMVEAIMNLLTDESTRYRMAICARRHSLQFDWNVVAENMRQVYAQVLA